MNTLAWMAQSPDMTRHEMWAVAGTVVLAISDRSPREGQVLLISRDTRAEAEALLLDVAANIDRAGWQMISDPFTFDLSDDLVTEALLADGDWRACPALHEAIRLGGLT